MVAAQEPSFIRPEHLWRELGLRADQTVVHLGCGAGFYLIPAAKIVGKGGQAIGVDVLPQMLAETENRARRAQVQDVVKTIRANLEASASSTLPAVSADWVLVANILHQSDPEKILQEAARIVRPTGKVVVVEWDVAASPLGPPHTKRIARTEARRAAEAHGLRQESVFAPSAYHYGLIFTTTAS